MCKSDFATCLLSISSESNFRLQSKQVRRDSSIRDASVDDSGDADKLLAFMLVTMVFNVAFGDVGDLRSPFLLLSIDSITNEDFNLN